MHQISLIYKTLMLFVVEELSGCFPDLLHFGSQTPVVRVVAYLSVEESVSLFVPSIAYCLHSYFP